MVNLNLNPECIDFFQNALASQINQLGNGLDAKIVIGLGTYNGDKLNLAKYVQMSMLGILEKNKKYFNKLPNIEVSETSEEYISYFALDMTSGQNIVEKKAFSHEDLLKRIDK